MTYTLFDPNSEPMLTNYHVDPQEQILMNFYQNTKISTQEYVVCKMMAILPEPQCVDSQGR